MDSLVRHHRDTLGFARFAGWPSAVRRRVAPCLAWACWTVAGTALAQAQLPDEAEAPELPLSAGAGLSEYGLDLGPSTATASEGLRSWEDPSVRILAATESLALNFSLVPQDEVWAAWSAEAVTASASGSGLGTQVPGQPTLLGSEPVMRLWIPLAKHGQRLRLTHAFVNLTRPGYVDGDLQIRPSAGVVMQLRSGTTYLQQLSLGSVFRLNTGQGSQLALRLRGGRLGLQYRLQFNL